MVRAVSLSTAELIPRGLTPVLDIPVFGVRLTLTIRQDLSVNR